MPEIEFDTLLEQCSNCIKEFTQNQHSPDQKIGHAVLQHCKAIGVFTTNKSSQISQGEFGPGLITARVQSGQWSPPVCATLCGTMTSNMGAERMETILCFMRQEDVRMITDQTNKQQMQSMKFYLGPRGGSQVDTLSREHMNGVLVYQRCNGVLVTSEPKSFWCRIEREVNRQRYPTGEPTAERLLRGEVRPSPDFWERNSMHECLRKCTSTQGGGMHSGMQGQGMQGQGMQTGQQRTTGRTANM